MGLFSFLGTSDAREHQKTGGRQGIEELNGRTIICVRVDAALVAALHRDARGAPARTNRQRSVRRCASGKARRTSSPPSFLSFLFIYSFFLTFSALLLSRALVTPRAACLSDAPPIRHRRRVHEGYVRDSTRLLSIDVRSRAYLWLRRRPQVSVGVQQRCEHEKPEDKWSAARSGVMVAAHSWSWLVGVVALIGLLSSEQIGLSRDCRPCCSARCSCPATRSPRSKRPAAAAATAAAARWCRCARRPNRARPREARSTRTPSWRAH